MGNGYDLGIRGLTFEDRTVDMRGQMAPQVTFGFEKTGERSAFRFGAASDVEGRDEVLVGRVRRDLTSDRLWLWSVSDNLRKGAATNAVQTAEVLIERGHIGKAR